jgi:hypothetical protein
MLRSTLAVLGIVLWVVGGVIFIAAPPIPSDFPTLDKVGLSIQLIGSLALLWRVLMGWNASYKGR